MYASTCWWNWSYLAISMVSPPSPKWMLHVDTEHRALKLYWYMSKYCAGLVLPGRSRWCPSPALPRRACSAPTEGKPLRNRCLAPVLFVFQRRRRKQLELSYQFYFSVVVRSHMLLLTGSWRRDEVCNRAYI